METLKYPYYAQNPNLNLRTVIDVRGNREYLSNCKKFGDVYLVKNIDIEYVEDRWIKKESLVLDHNTGNLCSPLGLLYGIVGVDDENREIFGYFSQNPYTFGYVITNDRQYSCMDVTKLNPKLYVESTPVGMYYSIKQLREVGPISALDNNRAPYNIEDHSRLFEERKHNYANSQIGVDADIRFAASYIKDLTFGAELETINGTLPVHIQNKYGIVICKDGSIKGNDGLYPPEYVTVPLQGAKGIQTLRNVSSEIAKRSDIDIKCSYHLHIGNMKIDRPFLVSLFKLCTKIQNDVLLMFPYYKTNPEGIKAKNYCKKLPLVLDNYSKSANFNEYINNTYTDIYCFLSGGIRPDNHYNHTTKVNPWGEGKWNIKTRYYWVNFVNMVFHKRETIEFRVHTPTLNSDKIINWLFMCCAIIKYAERYPIRCVSNRNISFIDVLNYYKEERKNSYASMLSDNLINYYNERVSLFKADYAKKDYVSSHDIKNDKTFKYNALKIK